MCGHITLCGHQRGIWVFWARSRVQGKAKERGQKSVGTQTLRVEEWNMGTERPGVNGPTSALADRHCPMVPGALVLVRVVSSYSWPQGS